MLNYTDLLIKDIVKSEKDKISTVYQYPADLKMAKLHRKAMKFGFNSTKRVEGEKSARCACCNLPINTKSLSMWQ